MAVNPERLEAFVLFAGLSREHLLILSGIATEKEYKKNEVIFADDTPGDAFYLIEDGQVRISKEVPGIGEEALAILPPGTYFGEMSAFTGAGRSADARCHEHCILIVFRNDLFLDLMNKDKDLANAVLWNMVRTLARRLSGANEQYRSLLAMSKPFM